MRAFGSSGNGSNVANAIKAAPDHSLYVGGQFSGTATFGGTSITAAGGVGIFVAKYSPSGSLLWIAQTAQTGAGAGGNQAANRIDLDADGNVYVTGSFYGSATFYSANPAGKQIKTASGLVPAIFLAKYTPAGVLLWVQTVTSDQPGPDPNVPMIGKGVAVNAAALQLNALLSLIDEFERLEQALKGHAQSKGSKPIVVTFVVTFGPFSLVFLYFQGMR